MNSQERAFHEFAEFAARLKGDEKSEAQTFLFHLLEAFGHDANTLPENCTFEYRVRFPGDRTKFADLVWPGRVLIEMKSRGAKLSQHYQQTFDYWLNRVPHRPPYVVLCNFDELWIYDFNTQLQEPVDRVKVSEIVTRHAALNFLFPRLELAEKESKGEPITPPGLPKDYPNPQELVTEDCVKTDALLPSGSEKAAGRNLQ